MANRPNILWLMTDEQRADSLGYEGAPWAVSPNLDRLAGAGVRFAAAYTPSPVCISARACLLTGRCGSSIGMLNNHHRLALADPRFLTWQFAAAGYAVASFGKHHYACSQQAFDLEAGQILGDHVGYLGYADGARDTDSDVVRYDGGRTPWIFAGRHPAPTAETEEMLNVGQALAWTRQRDRSRPFFLRVSLNAPHTPVVAPEPFDTMIDPGVIDLPADRIGDGFEPLSDCHKNYLIDYAGAHRLTPEQVGRARQCYYGRTAFVDHVFGALLDALERAGDLDNTVIAFVADHGCHLGDMGFFQKQSFWDVSARVPMFLCGPGVASAAVAVGTPVSTGSLLPTLLDLAGVDVPTGVEYPSLAPTLSAVGAPVDAPIFSEIDYGLHTYRNGQRRVMVRRGPWKLITYRDPIAHAPYRQGDDAILFNLQSDPRERTNLAAESGNGPVIADLIAAIDAWDQTRDIASPCVVRRNRL